MVTSLVLLPDMPCGFYSVLVRIRTVASNSKQIPQFGRECHLLPRSHGVEMSSSILQAEIATVWNMEGDSSWVRVSGQRG